MKATDKNIARWIADPVTFSAEVLHRNLWHAQRKMIRAVKYHRQVAVRSGNGVGKSATAAVAVLWFHMMFKDSRVITTATTWNQVKMILWAEIRKLFNQATPPMGSECHEVHTKMSESWLAYGLSVNDANAFAGGHNKWQLIVFDEAQGVPRPIWEAAQGMMSGSGTRWLVVGNPLESTGEFFQCFRDPQWHTLHIDCLEHPNVVTGKDVIPGAVSRDWVEKRRAQWGENHPLWLSRVRGMFPPSGDRVVIPLEYLDGAKDCVPTPGSGRHMGLDVAAGGLDENVATLVVDNVMVEYESWSGMDPMETCGRALDLAKRWNVPDPHIHLDNIGVGAGVEARMIELGRSVDGVCFGGGAEQDWPEIVAETQFANRRAELFWVVRELLRTKQACIPEHFRDVWTELSAPWYKFRSESSILVTPKDDVKSLLGRSPDHGDSLLLAFARTMSSGTGITRF